MWRGDHVTIVEFEGWGNRLGFFGGVSIVPPPSELT